MALQRREQYECRGVKEGVWGAFHSSAQTEKKKMCSENPDCRWSFLPPLPSTPPPSVSSPASPEGGVSSCVLVFCSSVSVCVVVVRRFSQACETAATDVAAYPLLKREEKWWRVYLHAAIHTPVSPRQLPVTWPSPPGSSVVCGRWTRPVKRGQSQRWCWSH